MHAIEHLKDCRWTTPDHYMGFDPVGDFLILSKHRDSDTVERSNFECAQRDLAQVQVKEPTPEQTRTQGEGWFYTFRASHFLCGWVEYLLVREDAPEEVLQAAGEIICSLSDYPVLDDDHHSGLEWQEAHDLWKSYSLGDRLAVLQQSEAQVSLFTIRRDEMPDDEQGRVYNWLRD
jgi:hypothetical protein